MADYKKCFWELWRKLGYKIKLLGAGEDCWIQEKLLGAREDGWIQVRFLRAREDGWIH